MSVLDTVKGKMKELADKANDLSGPAGDKLDSAKAKVAHGLEDAGSFVDRKTGGKYASRIHTGVDKAKGLLGKGEKPDGTDGPQQPGE